MKNFKNLLIWKKGFDIAVQCIKLSHTFPVQEKFGLCQQITRAAISIPSNIAEGSSRNSEKDQHRYLEIALGSSYELETQLLISGFAGYGDMDLRKAILIMLDEEQKMILAFMNRLRY